MEEAFEEVEVQAFTVEGNKHTHTHARTHAHTHTQPGRVAYRYQVDKGEVLSRHRHKEMRILLVKFTA